MAKAKSAEEVKHNLYALRRTDFGFHGKTTERAVTGGYTMPARDESIIRDTATHLKDYAAGGRCEAKHVPLKADRGTARPHGGYNRDTGAVENAVLRNFGAYFKAGRKAKRMRNLRGVAAYA